MSEHLSLPPMSLEQDHARMPASIETSTKLVLAKGRATNVGTIVRRRTVAACQCVICLAKQTSADLPTGIERPIRVGRSGPADHDVIQRQRSGGTRQFAGESR